MHRAGGGESLRRHVDGQVEAQLPHAGSCAAAHRGHAKQQRLVWQLAHADVRHEAAREREPPLPVRDHNAGEQGGLTQLELPQEGAQPSASLRVGGLGCPIAGRKVWGSHLSGLTWLPSARHESRWPRREPVHSKTPPKGRPWCRSAAASAPGSSSGSGCTSKSWQLTCAVRLMRAIGESAVASAACSR